MKNDKDILHAKKIFDVLAKTYPDAKTALKYKNSFELMVATILSAQSTDKQINKLTPALFARFKTPKDLATAQIKEIETLVRSSGFFRNKAKNIKKASQELIKSFGGKMPQTMDKLVTLPGVARKTANVILFNAFGKNEGIAVDTHVRRLSRRLGLTKNDNPEKIEIDLMALYPKNVWGKLTHILIAHGRAVCIAKNPKCCKCIVAKLCPSCKC